MSSKAFMLQRIHIFAGREIDPDSDQQVIDVLKERFEIFLPQRRSINESLDSSTSDHEIIKLILEYRLMR